MAAAFYYLAIATVILLGLVAGRWARSTVQAMLLGLMANLAAVVMLLCATVLSSIFAPGHLDPTDMGIRLGALLLFGSAVGVVAAIGGRRRRADQAAIRPL